MVPAQFTLDEDGRTYDLSGQAVPLMQIMQVLKANNIPMQGTIDMRSNPVVRKQVMAIVRNATRPAGAPAPAAAPAPSTGAAPAGAASPEASFAQRLSELEALRSNGAISDAEYTAKRQQIIAEL